MTSPAPVGRWLLVAAALVIVATVAVAVSFMGTPDAQRRARQDERRVRDLERIADEIRDRARLRKPLPTDLATLAGQPGRRLTVADPFTGTDYGYRALDTQRFELCAVFDTDTARAAGEEPRWADRQWPHPSGRHCFELIADGRKE